MGATVITNKAVFVFVPSVGAEPIYVLFEEYFEKNVFPHTPHWNCVYIGIIKNAMQRIFLSASSCEGGMNQTRKGRTRPELYIADWMKKLRSPILLNNRMVRLDIGPSWRATFTPALIAKIREQCTARTSEVMERVVRSGYYDIKLYDDIDVIHELIRLGNVPPWKIIEHWPGYGGLGDECPALGYAPTKAKMYSLTTPNAVRFGQEDILMQDEQGNWRSHGWAYSVVDRYVRDLWRDELIEPGSFKKRIEVYRSCIESSPVLSGEVSIMIDTTMLATLDDWKISSIERFLKDVKGHLSAKSRIMVTAENVYYAANLPREVTTWHFNMPTEKDQDQQSLFQEAA
jgi:hypothetical protein